MQPPISSSDEAREWLRRAQADLRIARLALNDRPPLTSEALYHCQQAVEKALKGFLAFHDQPIRKSHDLRELGEQIAALDTSLREIVEAAYPLTEFASRFRYPGAPYEPDAGEASAGMMVAGRVVAAIRAKLPESASSPGAS
ncbi:MAG: HEPN domain-containing protein [Bryobacterales bacterium]|nr:HEPN domain-containing protein [Bryobacterales bacterium]